MNPAFFTRTLASGMRGVERPETGLVDLEFIALSVIWNKALGMKLPLAHPKRMTRPHSLVSKKSTKCFNHSERSISSTLEKSKLTAIISPHATHWRANPSSSLIENLQLDTNVAAKRTPLRTVQISIMNTTFSECFTLATLLFDTP